MSAATNQETDFFWVREDNAGLRRLRRKSILDLRQQVNRLRRMKVGKLSEEQLLHRLRWVMDGYSTNQIILGSHGLYRARVNPTVEHFTNASELWYPPSDRTRLGRFNRAGDVVFYASNSPHTALEEVRPKVGQRVTLLVAAARDFRQEISCAHIGLHRIRESPETLAANENLRSHPGFQARLKALDVEKRWQIIDDYLSDVALRIPDKEGDEDLYRVTNAIGEILASANGHTALFYPSIATQLGSYNLALSPASADRLLYPFEAWAFDIRAENVTLFGRAGEIYEDMRELKVVARTGPIPLSGSLNWRAFVEGDTIDLHTALARARAQNKAG